MMRYAIVLLALVTVEMPHACEAERSVPGPGLPQLGRRLGCELAPDAVGKREGDRGGVQVQARCSGAHVQRVADDRRAAGSEVDADLVGAAGLWPRLN